MQSGDVVRELNLSTREREKKNLPFSLVESVGWPYFVPRPKFTKMKHLTEAQRYKIWHHFENGKNQKEISIATDISRSTISRELRRNRDTKGVYFPTTAHKCYKDRIAARPRPKKIDSEMDGYITERLGKKWSPEQIVGVAQKDGAPMVSHQTIYTHVWADKAKGGELYKELRNGGKRYTKRGKKHDRVLIRERVSIKERPVEVDQKQRVGDFEIDTVIGKGHKGALVTINDRMTGIVLIRKVACKGAEHVLEATMEALSPFKGILRTVTSDNGKEFALHMEMTKELGHKHYFADPFKSCQRGANENANGLIRQYLPKKTDFIPITKKQVQQIQDDLNNRPRKRLGYMTPIEFFNKHSPIAFST